MRSGNVDACSSELAVCFAVYHFAPFGPRLFSRHLHGKMLEPGILCCAMPVLYPSRDVHHVTRPKLPGFAAPLLIPPAPADADQHLPASAFRVMDMPVVPAARLKGHIECGNLFLCQNRKIALSGKILCESFILLSNRKYGKFVFSHDFILLVKILYLPFISLTPSVLPQMPPHRQSSPLPPFLSPGRIHGKAPHRHGTPWGFPAHPWPQAAPAWYASWRSRRLSPRRHRWADPPALYSLCPVYCMITAPHPMKKARMQTGSTHPILPFMDHVCLSVS